MSCAIYESQLLYYFIYLLRGSAQEFKYTCLDSPLILDKWHIDNVELLKFCVQVCSIHTMLTRWMVDLLLLMVPDHCDDQEQGIQGYKLARKNKTKIN